jgi:phosphatidylinositol glycan class B
VPQVSDRALPVHPLLFVGTLLGLVARLGFAFSDDGLLWPDEYYQSLEPAHRLVFGYGWQAWEFLEGARHWTLPAFVAGVMKVAALAGWDHLAAVRTSFCAVGSLTALAVYALARAQGATRGSAAAVSTVFSLMGLAVYVAPRAMGETLSALPITLAFALLPSALPLPPGGEGRGEGWPFRVIASGGLLSLAVGLRLQNGLFCLFALALLFQVKRRREALLLLGTLTLGALAYGSIDWLTWGKPFHSAVQYLKFNVLEGKSGAFGKHHALLYLQALVTAEGLTMLPLIGLSAYAWKTRRELPIVALGFVVVHSLIPHKELRFIFPVIPLLAAHAALGIDRLGGTALSPTLSPRGERGKVVLVACAVASLALMPTLTFGRLGIRNPNAELSALDYGGPENRLLREAGRLADLCGLRITSLEHWRTGGYAYLHKNVPLYGPRPAEDHANYVLARRGSEPGQEVLTDGNIALIKQRETCTPDPAYDWHLE